MASSSTKSSSGPQFATVPELAVIFCYFTLATFLIAPTAASLAKGKDQLSIDIGAAPATALQSDAEYTANALLFVGGSFAGCCLIALLIYAVRKLIASFAEEKDQR